MPFILNLGIALPFFSVRDIARSGSIAFAVFGRLSGTTTTSIHRVFDCMQSYVSHGGGAALSVDVVAEWQQTSGQPACLISATTAVVVA